MRKDKKAWLRIVEAFIAILIILGTVLIIMSKNKINVGADENSIYEKQKQILEVIAKNDDLREDIMINKTSGLRTAISEMIPRNWDFTILICGINEICNADMPNDKEIYTSEKIISSTLNKYELKKIKFFVWMK